VTMSAHRLATAGLLAALLAATATYAAPGFIASAQVTGGAYMAEISVEFACVVEYIDHLPARQGERLRIQLRATPVCNGVAPTITATRQQFRPLHADTAHLVEIDYDGDVAAGPTLTLVFSEAVHFSVAEQPPSRHLTVNVLRLDTSAAALPQAAPGAPGVRVTHPAAPDIPYLVNLSSSRTPHTAADMPTLAPEPGTEVYETAVELAGSSWYRLRVGPFESTAAAEAAASAYRQQYPNAWVARDTAAVDAAGTTRSASAITASPFAATNAALAAVGLDEVDALMSDARRAMVAGELSRAVQLYTKVLQVPNHDRHPEALEYLALAREKNGQTAHAKAEYERYLSLYPDHEGAARVRQRLAVLLAASRPGTPAATTAAGAVNGGRAQSGSTWRLQTFFSQNYRRDVNQQGDEDAITSQSALYSDINLDARRRGTRFDFSSRLSAGYRNDFLPEDEGSGNATRVSYAYADLADPVTGLRGRIGRQSRNTGGVLGRFDGLNLGYQLGEKVLLNTVVGKPAYSASDGIDSARSFYGASIDYGPLLENLELGLYYIQQSIEGIRDRQAVGAEFRYFGASQSLWGMLDYDLGYGEIASAYLQGSWRFASRLSIHGLVDRRGSPFLSTGNALIGQPVASFAELAEIFSDDELQQLGRDRTAMATTATVGVSYPLAPKLQLTADVSQSSIDATPASGGMLETPGSTYRYYSTSLVASSLFKEGDVSIFSTRYSESDTSKVVSMTLDSRFPIGRRWRINPRLRVDLRQNRSDLTDEWFYTPGLRIYYRRSQKFRINLEAGKQFSQRESTIADLDRESYFVNVGYQAFF